LRTKVNLKDGSVRDVDALVALRIDDSNTVVYANAFTPISAPPIAPVEMSAEDAAAPPVDPVAADDAFIYESPEIYDDSWQPYLDADLDVDLAFLVGLGI
jgi:hypothetical protein